AVQGREVTCGVLRSGDEVRTLPVCEIKTSREFFDYEAKYHSKDTQEIIPAEIPDQITRMIQERSAAIYRAFNCRGMVRVDHFWTGGNDAGSIVTIELNTVPGFSGASIFPKMLEAAGLQVKDVINGMIGEMVKDQPIGRK
ncbi:MAG: D-alanine--D-alanine ligase, partial [Bacteroidota bacterium]|nr:D-alanine--D-alanine ligase [Bacteroidota bacterium]